MPHIIGFAFLREQVRPPRRRAPPDAAQTLDELLADDDDVHVEEDGDERDGDPDRFPKALEENGAERGDQRAGHADGLVQPPRARTGSR